MARIDAHQHFWSLTRDDYGWLTPELAPIYRDFQPQQLQPLLSAQRIDGTIVVQAAPTRAETNYLLSMAAKTPFIRGVVGWEDFDSNNATDNIAELAANKALVGLRPMIQDIPDHTWMLKQSLTSAFDTMIQHNLRFDALTLPHHLKPLLELASRHPQLKMVVDHGSKPDINNRKFDGWAQDISLIAAETGAYCKLSGLVTEASPNWTTEDLQPYADHLLNTFGPHRLIWGSDWPVCTLACSYERWITTTDTLLKDLPDAEQRLIMGDNALRFYFGDAGD